MLYRFSVLTAVCAVALSIVVPAGLAFDCTVAKKPPTAGSVGTIDANGDFTPSKPNPGTEEQAHGGFIVFTDGDLSVSTFLHAPDGVLPPAREDGSQHNCDGKGIDTLDVCFGE